MVRMDSQKFFEVIQHTDVKTSKVIFSGENDTQIFWLGKYKGRCLALWERDRSIESDPYKVLATKNVLVDPNDVCIIGPKKVCVGFADGSISILNIDLEDIVNVKQIPSVHNECSSVSVIPYDNSILSASSNGSVVKIDIEKNKTEKIISGQSSIKSITTSLGGHLVVTGNSTGQVSIWDVREKNSNESTLNPIQILVPSKKNLVSVTSLCSHPAQSNLICCGTDDGIIGLIDLRNGQNSLISSTYLVAKKTITQVMFHPTSSDNLICSSNDGSLLRIDASCVPTRQPAHLRNAAKHNVWLADDCSGSLRNEQIKQESVYPISSFDCKGDCIVSSLSIGMISTLENLAFFPSLHGIGKF